MQTRVDGDAARRRLLELASLVVLGLLAAWQLADGWQAWSTPDIDVGRELYTAWSISEGAALYQDIWLPRGPLSSYANALVFALFGASMMTLAMANLVWLALLGALLHCHVRRDFGATAAFLVSFLLLSVFALSRYSTMGNYNFVLPYAHEVTHGIVLSLVTLTLLLRSLRAARMSAWTVATGISLGLVLLTKQEVAVAAVVATSAILVSEPSRSMRERAQSLGWMCVGACLPLGLAFVALGSDPFVMMWGLPVAEVVRESPFYASNLGLDRPAMRLVTILIATGVLGLEWIVAESIGRWLDGRGRLAHVLAVAAWLSAHLLLLGSGGLPPMQAWLFVPAVLPPVALAVGGVTLAGRIGRQRWLGGRAYLCWLAIFGAVMLIKTGLNPRVYHYGFAQSLPAAIVLVIAGASLLRFPFAKLVMSASLAAFCLYSLHLSHQAYAPLVRTLGKNGDEFRVARGDQRYSRAMTLLVQNARPDDSLLVLPEGVLFNYLARLRNPTRHISFMPFELLLTGEDAVVRDLVADPPTLVLQVERNVEEYGYRRFGEPRYGREIMTWLHGDYIRRQGRAERPPWLYERR